MEESYRFVIFVDVQADTLEEAYVKLLARMNANDWESTDEAYAPDGEQIDATVLQSSKEAVLGLSFQMAVAN